jgi:cytoskeletal protein CcmA (bactofilin family)
MKTRTITAVILTALSMNTIAQQTIYVPSGTGGIGTSSTSNIGVGISNPLYGKFVIFGNGSEQGLTMYCNGITSFRQYVQTDNNVYFNRGGDISKGFMLDASGYLGIGTSAPTEKLDVNGTVKANALTTSNINSTGDCTVKGTDYTWATLGSIILGGGYNYQGSGFPFGGDVTISAGTGYVNGNIILNGITNLNGTLSATGNISTSGALTAGSATINGALKANNITSKSNSDLVLQTSGTTRMTFLNSNGYIGIGTTNPTAMLTVKGKILAGQVEIKDVGTIPDYVFKPDYKLMSIPELESYIKQNGHLPDTKSAKEFEEQGMNISDMNNLLLKNVEELSLYVIELNKRLETLENENQALRSK